MMGRSVVQEQHMSDEAIKKALELNIPTYISDRECPHGHGKLRYAKNNSCVTCAKLAVKRSRDGNRIRKYKRRGVSRFSVTVPPGLNLTDDAAVALLRGLGFTVKVVTK